MGDFATPNKDTKSKKQKHLTSVKMIGINTNLSAKRAGIDTVGSGLHFTDGMTDGVRK